MTPPALARARKRQYLLLLTGLAILIAVVLSGAAPKTTTAQQGFPKADQSRSVLPDTVTLRPRT